MAPHLMDSPQANNSPESFHAAAVPAAAIHPQQHSTTTTNAFGETSLFRVAWLGQTETVQTLLSSSLDPQENGANPNHADQNGCTPLHYTSCCDTVQALLQAGADPTRADRFGNTPLHAAAMAGDVDVARLLLSSSSSSKNRPTSVETTGTVTQKNTSGLSLLYARNVHGETPLDRCRVLRRTDMAQFLLQQYMHYFKAQQKQQQRGDNPIHAILQEAAYRFPKQDESSNKAQQQQPPRVQLRIGTVSMEQLLYVFDLILQRDPTAIFGSVPAAIQWGAPPHVLYFLLRQDPETLLRMDSPTN